MKERIKHIRKTFGLTLEKFGQRVGVGKTAISKIENGENNITDQMIKSICREFNVNEEWLRTGEGEMQTELDREDQLMQWAGAVLADESNSFKKKLVRVLASLSEEEWEFLERKAYELVDSTKKD